MPDKKEIIRLLFDMADMMEFNGENKFKVAAFRNGANTLRSVEKDLDELIKSKELGNIKGIGKGLQSVIYEFTETGKSSGYEELKKNSPAGIEELFQVRGLGAKKLKILYDELNITNLGELEYACKENRITLLKGFGEKTQENILKQIDQLRVYSKFILLNHAEKIYYEIAETFSKLKSVNKFETTGEFRRRMETISSIEIVVLAKDANKFKSDLKKHFSFDISDSVIILTTDYPVSSILYLTSSDQEYYSKLFETTGSKEFLEKLMPDSRKYKANSEEAIFKTMDMNFIIPEMRESEYFEQKKKNLIENSNLDFNDFKGLLHFHTTYSDGRDTLSEMIERVKKMGMQYAAVCDHSKSAFYANGLKEERVLEQKKEVEKASKEKGIMVFQGIESDILQDGNLDYADDFLNEFDFVVASVHSRFTLSKEEMTKRIIKAVENVNTDVLGHPSGRLLLSRDPYQMDYNKMIDACVENKVAIEINANPRRLDLDWRWIYYAREKGCLFSINADAHYTDDFDYTKYGVWVGRKGGLKKEEIINCFGLNNFKKFLSRKVKRNLK
jgi:DNA polymerase (family 10)